MIILKQSTASQAVKLGPFVDSADGVTAETGLTIANTDIKLSKAGGTLGSKNSGGGTHDADGWYTITLDATDTATVGALQVTCTMSGALPVFATFQVVEEAVYDALFGASATGKLPATLTTADVSGNLPANVIAVSGDTTAADNLEADYDGTGYNKSASTIGTCTTNADMRGTDGANTTTPLDSSGTQTACASAITAAAPISANMTQIQGHALAGTGTQLADAFETFFNVATPLSMSTAETLLRLAASAVGAVTVTDNGTTLVLSFKDTDGTTEVRNLTYTMATGARVQN